MLLVALRAHEDAVCMCVCTLNPKLSKLYTGADRGAEEGGGQSEQGARALGGGEEQSHQVRTPSAARCLFRRPSAARLPCAFKQPWGSPQKLGMSHLLCGNNHTH